MKKSSRDTRGAHYSVQMIWMLVWCWTNTCWWSPAGSSFSDAFVLPSSPTTITTTRRISQIKLFAAVPASNSGSNNNNNKSSKTTTSSPSPSSSRNGNSTARPARFAQSVHRQTGRSFTTTKIGTRNTSTSSSSLSATTTTRPMNADRVWQSRQKSVEELEAILTKRWGTNWNTFTAKDWDEDDDDDTNDNTNDDVNIDNRNNNVQQQQATTVFRAKPVVDPWNPPTTKTTTTTTTPTTREYYDEDDEGYNNSNNNKKKQKNNNNNNSHSLDYMIAPRPAGGSGHLRQTSFSTTNTKNEQSYFLRPPPTEHKSVPSVPPTTQNEASTGRREKSTMTTPTTTTNAETAAKPTAMTKKERIIPIPLLDEDGNTICLTTAQAERLFEQMTGRDDLIMNKDENDQGDDVDDEYYLENADAQEEAAEEDFPLATVAAQTETTWQDLGIQNEVLLDNLQAMSCATPLPVQQQACADMLTGRDVVIGTYTGSGKTLAFLVPALQRLMADDAPADQLRILVVAPGRELASQIVSVARQVCEGTSYTAQLAIGGTTFSRNLQTIRQRRPSILVGTPGRLAELIVGKPGEKGGRLKVNNLQTLVLDEFDALLEYKPHREPTSALVERLQQRRPDLQSILCSATATDVLKSPKFQRFVRPDYALALTEQDDVFVTADDNRSTRVSRTVMHGVVHVPHRRFVLDTIRRILHTDPLPQQILMFVDNSRKVDLMVEKLEGMGILAAPLHGGSRNDKMDRAEVSKALREGYVGIVVATELAARGLDAPLLTHVINVDLPTDASHYAHRAGRCGRGGRPGVVLNLTSDPKDRKVPQKFADQLGFDLYTVDVRNGKLNVVDPESVDFDAL